MWKWNRCFKRIWINCLGHIETKKKGLKLIKTIFLHILLWNKKCKKEYCELNCAYYRQQNIWLHKNGVSFYQAYNILRDYWHCLVLTFFAQNTLVAAPKKSHHEVGQIYVCWIHAEDIDPKNHTVPSFLNSYCIWVINYWTLHQRLVHDGSQGCPTQKHKNRVYCDRDYTNSLPIEWQKCKITIGRLNWSQFFTHVFDGVRCLYKKPLDRQV